MDRGPLGLVLALIVTLGLGAWVLLSGAPEEPADTASPIPATPTTELGDIEPAEPPVMPGPMLEGAGVDAPESAPQPARAPVQGGVRFTGMVMTQPDVPAAGATIEVHAITGVVATATSQDDGSFEFRLVVTDEMSKDWAQVRANGADGTIGWAALSFLLGQGPGQPTKKVEGEAQVGTILLGPAHALDVVVSSSCPSAFPAKLWLLNAQWAQGPPWAVVETDADGRASLAGVPKGRWRLVAASKGCGRAWTLVQLPKTNDEAVELELPDAHAVMVTVRDASDQTPIAGAQIRVNEQLRLPDYYTRAPLLPAAESYTTDEQGRVRIEGLGGTETLYLHASAEGYPGGSEHTRGRGRGPGQTTVPPGTTEVTIDLHQPMTVRWPLEDKGSGIPADGTEVVLKPWTNTGRLTVPEKGVIENGELVVTGWGPDGASGYATVPGGLIARLSAGPKKEVGFPTAFYPLRKIEAIVRLPDGSPAEGWFLSVKDGGNNAVAPDVKTDADGRAVMQDLFGGPGSMVNVSVSDQPGWQGYTKALGSVNLQKENGRFEVDIPAERTLHIRAMVSGGAVPDGFQGSPRVSHRPIQTAEDSGEPGLFIVRWRPANPEGKVWISIQTATYIPKPVTVELAGTRDPIEVTVDLEPAGALDVQVKEPEDKRYKVSLEQWNDEQKAWGPAQTGAGFQMHMGGGQRADPNGIVSFKLLRAGRYRAMETHSGIRGSPVDVVAGAEPARTELDASTAGWVRGRVEVPEGQSFAGVAVGEVGLEAPTGPAGFIRPSGPTMRPVNPKDGTFWYRVPGTRPVTLRLYHMTLKPHPTQGRVTVTKPREGVVLTAVAGAVATVRFSTPAVVFINRGQARPIAVRLYPGEVQGEGIKLSGMLDAEHKKVEFGGYQPGTWTVWIDAPGCAPVVLKNTKLGEGDADLGEVTLEQGSLFKINVKVKEGQSPPRFSVWLQKVDEPAYTRNVDAAGETITVQGLGPGRFRVSASAYNGATKGIDEEIEFDGVTEVVRTIDAR